MQQFNNIQPIRTDDGSTTLYLPELNETYHSRRGAQTESGFIYIERGLATVNSSPVRVLEIGFGTGLNAILSYHFALTHGLDVEYHTVEAYPLPESIVATLEFPILSENPDLPSILLKMHSAQNTRLELGNAGSRFHFRLLADKIENVALEPQFFDVVYFDAFAPSKQSDIWEKPVLSKVYNAMKPGGSLVTYCSQGQFKRDLKQIGFTTEHPQGPMGKKEMTIARVPEER